MLDILGFIILTEMLMYVANRWYQAALQEEKRIVMFTSEMSGKIKQKAAFFFEVDI